MRPNRFILYREKHRHGSHPKKLYKLSSQVRNKVGLGLFGIRDLICKLLAYAHEQIRKAFSSFLTVKLSNLSCENDVA